MSGSMSANIRSQLFLQPQNKDKILRVLEKDFKTNKNLISARVFGTNFLYDKKVLASQLYNESVSNSSRNVHGKGKVHQITTALI